MRPMTLICVVLGAVLGLLETSGIGREGEHRDGASKTATVPELGELPLDVSLEGTRSTVALTLPVASFGLPVRYSVSIETLSGQAVGEVTGTKEVPADGRIELRMSGPSLGLPAEAVDYVVVYRVKGKDGAWEGRRSLYYCMKRTLLAVTPPTVVALSGPVRIPVRVMHANQEPAAKATVTFIAKADGKEVVNKSVATDEFGGAVLSFQPKKTGPFEWQIRAQAPGALPMTSQGTVDVADAGKLLLTLDKPLYQPGQTVHIRSLLLEKPSLKPRANQGVVLEGFDTKGNKIFKHRGVTNEFGVISATLAIGSQVNMGSWRIEAHAGDVTAQKSFTVDRYSLPKFKGTVQLDKPFYRPGEEVNGTISLKYFFGKPVAGGKVKVTAHDYQGQWVIHRVIEGETNPEGLYKFAYRLPEKLIGQPLGNGNAIVLVELEGTDTAGQLWKDSRQVTVVANPLSVAVVPESGTLVPEVENRLHVIVADAGGAAVTGMAKVVLSQGGESVEKSLSLDASGISSVLYTPKKGGAAVVAAITVDLKGQTLTQQVTLATTAGQSVLLRPGKSIAAVGETVVFEVFSSDSVGDAWLDITRENQTLLTANVRMKGGRGSVTVTLDAGMAGTLTASAYTLTHRAELTRDSRVLFVNTQGDLKVNVTADKEQYKPAEKAKLLFNVTDAAGKAVQAALGIHVVDEAVFALSESRPGLAKLYFLLEAAIMEPSWQVGPLSGQTLGGLMEPVATQDEESSRQLKAEVALGAQGEVGTALPAQLIQPADAEEIHNRMDKRSQRMQRQIVKMARRYGKCNWEQENFRNTARLDKRLRAIYEEDAWGNAYQVDVSDYAVSLRSAGPDEQWGTGDDLYAYTESYEVCEYNRRYKAGVRGGWVRGVGDMVMDDAMVPMATGMGGGGGPGQMVEMRKEATAQPAAGPRKKTDDSSKKATEKANEPEVRVRQWFPETLFVEDCLITDANGNASLEVPLADSIASWRMTTMASDKAGRMGGSESGIIVFQDFFVDIDFPAFLTRNDEVSFPVVIYNYLDRDQEIRISLDKEPWFELSGESEVTVKLAAGQVKALRFPVKVTRVGWHQLTVWGRGEKGVADAVRRTVEVRSDGMEVVGSSSGQFDPTTKEGREIRLPYAVPENAVEGSQKMSVQILPALSTHVIGGMESMLRLPGGCFEQTTSSAWPNVLAMRYLRDTKQNTPELSMKAMQYILAGYQRILTFECKSGGFNWWEGENPGNLILSALSIMMLSDTKEVLDAVDTRVIQRSYAYLLTLQKGDGSFAAETHLHAGNENLGQDSLRSTCYVAWAFNEGGFGDTEPAKKAQRFIQGKLASEQDLYTLAMCANALATLPGRGEAALPVLDRIFLKAVKNKKHIYFEQAGRTLVNSGGLGGHVELTALVAHAALRGRAHLAEIMPIVEWLVSTKDPQGNWGYNTQASVMALKVFLLASSMGSEKTEATVTMTLNGRELASRKFDDFNKDVIWQVDVPAEKMGTRGELSLTLTGEGSLGYQVVGTWFEAAVKAEAQKPALEVGVEYDRTQIKVDETVKVGVTVKANDPSLQGMVMLTLGVPPGFDVQTEDLELLRSQKAISKWELTGRQLLIYLNGVPKDSHLAFDYRIKARYPVKAATGESEVHMYYDAQKQGRHAGTQLTVE